MKNNFWMSSTTHLSLRLSKDMIQTETFTEGLFAVKKNNNNNFLLLYGKCTVRFLCDMLQRSSACKTPAYFFFIRSTCHKVSSNLHFMGSLTRHIVLNSSWANGVIFYLCVPNFSSISVCRYFQYLHKIKMFHGLELIHSNYNTLIKFKQTWDWNCVTNQVINCARSSY